MYSKNANKGIFTSKLPEDFTGATSNDLNDTIVYYLCGAVVYGCTTPLIHGVKGDGCLSEKFF